MADFWTNNGFRSVLSVYFSEESQQSSFRLVLITADTAPTASTTTFSGLTEIGAGNGYTSGGVTLTPDTDTTTTQDNGNSLAKTVFSDKVITASGGSIPASGNPIRYVLLTDANATLADREVFCVWDLGANTTIASGNTLTLDDLTPRLLQP